MNENNINNKIRTNVNVNRRTKTFKAQGSNV